jgi:pyrrolidone-carboxylate peptidase
MVKKQLCLLTSYLLLSTVAQANTLTVEELRINSAEKAIPAVVNTFSMNINELKKLWGKTDNFEQAQQIVKQHSYQLWRDAKKQILSTKLADDRPLYWARLQMSRVMRTVKPSFNISETELAALLNELEQGSRGRTELNYTKNTNKKILLTGFDPFLLDRNINQSNPSGIAALKLDGQVIEYKGVSAEINTVMTPVIYGSFDNGTIESLLAPYYALNNVDMIVTVSMGRKDFDLERFPGKRRSVTAPDNLNVLSGGTKTSPIIPKLHDMPLPGAEFVEFSLPVTAMQKAVGDYKVIDNHQVTSINNAKQNVTFKPDVLEDLNGHIAVSGSGGGYLSNEISYRSIRLRNELNSTIPTGHIHTPRIQQYEPEIEEKIVSQIRKMLEMSLTDI